MKEIIALVKLMVASLALLPFGGAGYLLYVRANAPAYRPTAEELARAESWATFWQWSGMAFVAAVLLAVALAGFGAALRFALIPAWKDRHTYKPDEKGMFPLIHTSYSGQDDDGHRVQYESFYDQNSSITPGTTIVKNGSVDILPHSDGDLSMHHDYSSKRLGYLAARAMSGGDGSGRRGRGMNRAEVSLISGEAAARTERAKLQAEHQRERLDDWRVQHAQTIEAPALPMQPMTLDEAIQRSTPDLFVVGQNESGQIAKWSLRTAIHGALIGSTGTGKTSSVGMKIIVDAIRHGHHTLILDGMGGDDLGVFKSHAEWYDMNAETLPDQIASLHRLHESRIGNWSQRIVCVIEEFNDAWESMENRRLIETYLATLLNKGRHSGIHLLFIAQETRTWPDAVFNGVKARFVFQVGGKEAGRLGEWHAQHLPDQGRFIFRNEEYEPWHVAPRVRTLMNAMPAMNATKLLTNERTNGAFSEVRTVANVRERGEEGVPESSENTPPLPLVRAFETDRSWDAIGKKFFEIFPDGTQADLRSTMSRLDGRQPDAFKGEAFRLYHAYSTNGNRR